MYEYGNARIAALRRRLLDPDRLRQLAESGSARDMASQLRLEEDWRLFFATGDQSPSAAIDELNDVIERHRAARLGALPRWYEPPARPLVEALVLPLDIESVTAALRRRLAGESAEVIGRSVQPGGVLDAARLAEIARAPSLPSALRLLGRLALIDRLTADRIGALYEGGATWEAVEAALVDACERARDERAAGRGGDAAQIRALLAAERSRGRAVLAELLERGIDSAAALERRTGLAELHGLARRARRDPLGIGVVAGYVAAVESQAIALRAIVARVAAGWGRDRMAAYFAAGGA